MINDNIQKIILTSLMDDKNSIEEKLNRIINRSDISLDKQKVKIKSHLYNLINTNQMIELWLSLNEINTNTDDDTDNK